MPIENKPGDKNKKSFGSARDDPESKSQQRSYSGGQPLRGSSERNQPKQGQMGGQNINRQQRGSSSNVDEEEE